MPDNVTRFNLNDVMEFDHVIQVHADGTVTDAESSYWAPEVSVRTDDAYDPITVSARPDQAWELMDGYSGQYLYHGPVMHPSEYIGGKLADDILATPGLYVAVVVSDSDADDDTGNGENSDGEGVDVGWAVARLTLGSE